MSCEAPAVPKHTAFESVLDVSEALVALTQLPCLCRASHKLRLSHRCNFDHCAMFDSIGAVKFKSPPHQPVALRASWVMMAPGELQCPAVPGSSVCCPQAKEQQGSWTSWRRNLGHRFPESEIKSRHSSQRRRSLPRNSSPPSSHHQSETTIMPSTSKQHCQRSLSTEMAGLWTPKLFPLSTLKAWLFVANMEAFFKSNRRKASQQNWRQSSP